MRSIPLPQPGDEPLGQGLPDIGTGSPPLAPPQIRTLLKSLGLHPQKGFGQNFLTSESILKKIVKASDLSEHDTVIEVGPGLGHLTRHLARQVGRLIAIEIDRGLARVLRQTFQGASNVEVVEADVLEVIPSTLVGDQPYKVIANLPYYITSAALRHFLEAAHRPTMLVVMLQKEVADRILAPKGHLNLLAISVQVYGQPRPLAFVSASCFYPRPKVDSEVIRIDLFPQPKIEVDPEKFFKVVGAGFAMPRKQIHNSLSQRLWMPPGQAPEILREAGIDPMRRPQTLSIEEWNRLTQILEGRGLV